MNKRYEIDVDGGCNSNSFKDKNYTRCYENHLTFATDLGLHLLGRSRSFGLGSFSGFRWCHGSLFLGLGSLLLLLGSPRENEHDISSHSPSKLLKTCALRCLSARWFLNNVNKTHLMAWSLWALRTSGFWLRLAKISVRDAPTMARWNFWVFLVFFLASSSTWPFLCLRLNKRKQNVKGMKHTCWWSCQLALPVKHSPGCVTGVPLHQMRALAFRVQKLVGL